jgi:S-adenosylmethionine decarboxylase
MKAEIHNYKNWISITDASVLKEMMIDFLQASGFTVMNEVDHFYEPDGYTAVWLLAESHLAIHSFPEENKTYVEISSCNQEKNQKFIHLIQKYILK